VHCFPKRAVVRRGHRGALPLATAPRSPCAAAEHLVGAMAGRHPFVWHAPPSTPFSCAAAVLSCAAAHSGVVAPHRPAGDGGSTAVGYGILLGSWGGGRRRSGDPAMVRRGSWSIGWPWGPRSSLRRTVAWPPYARSLALRDPVRRWRRVDRAHVELQTAAAKARPRVGAGARLAVYLLCFRGISPATPLGGHGGPHGIPIACSWLGPGSSSIAGGDRYRLAGGSLAHLTPSLSWLNGRYPSNPRGAWPVLVTWSTA